MILICTLAGRSRRHVFINCIVPGQPSRSHIVALRILVPQGWLPELKVGRMRPGLTTRRGRANVTLLRRPRASHAVVVTLAASSLS